MAALRRTFRRSSSLRRRPRRKLVWARATNTPAGTAIPAGTVQASDLLADYDTQSGGGHQGATIMAVRGYITAYQQTSPGSASALTMGIRVDDRVLVTLPAAELLARRGPVSSARYTNWMARRYWWYHFGGLTTSPLNTQDAEVFFRSRRKLDELNETLVVYFENPVGSATVDYAFWFDTLLALP